MIYESFQAWEESPVSTNIETLPITEIAFPKVTVCPPKDTYTDLNYDLMMTENMNISNEVRNNLLNYARNLLKDHLHHVVMTNFSKISEDNLYRKWYQGYTTIQGPHWSDHYNINFHWDSYATSGTIKTENFGKKFDIEIKVYLMEIMLLCVIANILDLGQEFQFEENVFQLSGEIAITKPVITSYIRKLPSS